MNFEFVLRAIVTEGEEEEKAAFENGNNVFVMYLNFAYFDLVDQDFVTENKLNYLFLDVQV